MMGVSQMQAKRRIVTALTIAVLVFCIYSLIGSEKHSGDNKGYILGARSQL